MVFMVYHGRERMDEKTRSHLRESPWVITLPLILLAIPSLFLGWVAFDPLLLDNYFGSAIFVLPQHDVLAGFAAEYTGPVQFLIHGLQSPPAWLAVAGVATAWFIVLGRPDLAKAAADQWPRFYAFLMNKYGFDDFNQKFFAAGSRGLGQFLWKYGDMMIIDDGLVNGSARAVSGLSARLRRMQSGYLYHYVFVMVIGMTALVGWLYWGFD